MSISPKTFLPTPHGYRSDRDYWVQSLTRVCRPVFLALSQNKLKHSMPLGIKSIDSSKQKLSSTFLEALGRSICGIAPWMELSRISDSEAKIRNELREKVLLSLSHAVDFSAPDYLHLDITNQALVDYAFVAQGFLRAPSQIWNCLSPTVQQHWITILKESREILPSRNNWLLFSAIIEAFLCAIDEKWDRLRVDSALHQFEQWYLGDGIYSDGAYFRFDYYNSYVIHPMILDILEVVATQVPRWQDLYKKYLEREQRFAAIQERTIAPDGTFPPVGRSITYRGGAFHLLARSVFKDQLPAELSPAQVRSALTAVLQRTLDIEGTFDSNGWLKIGLAGYQPSLAERYISTGSLYLCSTIYLPLGLAEDHAFWSTAQEPWTSQKIWNGQNVHADHAIQE